MSQLLHPSRRVLALVLAVFVVAGAGGAVLVVRALGSEQPPATGAARMVPADALLYVHLSTDPDRGGVKRGRELAARFPSFPVLQGTLFGLLAPAGQRFNYDRDVRPWLGDEAAFAFLNTESDKAGTLIVLAVSNGARARAFLRRVGDAVVGNYRGVPISTYDRLSTAFVGRYLVVGPAASVQESIDVYRAPRDALARVPRFRRAQADLPTGRVLDAWASRDGVRRLLAPQGGFLSVVGRLLDNPALQGSAVAVTAEDPGARISVHTELDPDLAPGRPSPYQPFDPGLVDGVPRNTLAYLGVTGLARAGGPLLSLAGGAGLGSLISQFGQALGTAGTTALQRDVLSLLRGEVAIVITPKVPFPIFTLIARTGNEGRTAEAFARLQEPLAKLVGTPGTDGGQVPIFRERDVEGVKAFSLEAGPSTSVSYAVFDGKAVISTSLDGIRAARAEGSIGDNDAYKDTLGHLPDRVTSVVFLDLNQLLTLAEQTGLNEDPGYSRVREDLRRVGAVGLTTGSEKDVSTAELRLSIP